MERITLANLHKSFKKLDGKAVETLILCGDDSLYKALESVVGSKEKGSSEVAPQRV